MKPRVFKEYPLHVELWKWLAKHPDKEKENWLMWKSNGGNIEKVDCLCFACEAAEHSLHNSCTNCPINWGKKIEPMISLFRFISLKLINFPINYLPLLIYLILILQIQL